MLYNHSLPRHVTASVVALLVGGRITKGSRRKLPNNRLSADQDADVSLNGCWVTEASKGATRGSVGGMTRDEVEV